MKLNYKSESFQLDYDDQHERSGHREWSEAANERSDQLVKLIRQDIEKQTEYQQIINELKRKAQP